MVPGLDAASFAGRPERLKGMMDNSPVVRHGVWEGLLAVDILATVGGSWVRRCRMLVAGKNAADIVGSLAGCN